MRRGVTCRSYGGFIVYLGITKCIKTGFAVWVWLKPAVYLPSLSVAWKAFRFGEVHAVPVREVLVEVVEALDASFINFLFQAPLLCYMILNVPKNFCLCGLYLLIFAILESKTKKQNQKTPQTSFTNPLKLIHYMLTLMEFL